MNRTQRPLTDREVKAWLAAGAVDRGVGDGLTLVASAAAASAGKGSWILRYRLNGRAKEKVLGRYPELSLKDAREQARKDRSQIERGIDVAVVGRSPRRMWDPRMWTACCRASWRYATSGWTATRPRTSTR